MKRLVNWTIWQFACAVAIAQVLVPEGTRLRVRLDEDISSANAQRGEAVRLSVVDEVKVGDTVVIAGGAPVTGRITEAVPKRFTKSGKLDFSADRVTAADGGKILLRYNREKDPASMQSGVISSGATMLLGPAGLVVGMMRAKDVTLQSGMIVEVFTDEDHTFQPPTPPVVTAKPAEPKPAPPVEMVNVTVNSTPGGARVTVDGVATGETPASFQLKPGEHEVQLEREGFALWKGKLEVKTGAPASLEAKLELADAKSTPNPEAKPAAVPAARPKAKPAAKAPKPSAPKE